jgi:hypothetical protein
LSSNLDDFLHAVISGSGTGVTAKIGEYFLKHKGQDLDTLLTTCPANISLSQSNVSRFSKKMRRATRALIAEQGCLQLREMQIANQSNGDKDSRFPQNDDDIIDELIRQASSDLIARACAQSIPIRNLRDRMWDSDHIYDGLNNLDETARVKEILRFCNCIVEFYTGERLFSSLPLSASTLQPFSPQKAVVDIIAELKSPLQEEHLSEKAWTAAWEAGFLQCEIDR